MAKTLKELLNKYVPNSSELYILENGTVERSLVDKEKRCLEVYVSFSEIISKEELYSLEEGVKKAYNLQMCKLKPHYPKETFYNEYIRQILLEAEREGTVARGFFGRYNYSVDENVITVKIPFSEYGIDLLECAKTPSIIENIIKSEFDLVYKVVIEQNGEDVMRMSNEYISRLEDIDRQISDAQKNYGSSFNSDPKEIKQENENKLPRLASGCCTPMPMKLRDAACRII